MLKQTEYFIKSGGGESEPGNLAINAIDVNICDSGSYYSSNNAEGALQEVGLSLSKNVCKQTIINTFPKKIEFEPFHPSWELHPSKRMLMRGVDRINNRLLALCCDDNGCYQSEDGGSNWSTNKGLPYNVNNFTNVTMFKNQMYIAGQNSIDNTWAIYRTDPASGDMPFIWSTELKILRGSSAKPLLTADDKYIYASEYGLPCVSGGPSIYRSPDGVRWETVFGPDSSIYHFHCIAADPYVSGHIWATCGDVPSPFKIFRSTNYGEAGSWIPVSDNISYQSVQISFSQKRIYFAADSDTSRATAFYIDRNNPNLSIKIVSKNIPRNIAVPGGGGILPGYLKGGSNPSTNISRDAANTFKIVVDRETVQQTVMLDQTVCTNGELTAKEMQTKIRSLGWPYSGVTVRYDGSKYIITSGAMADYSKVWCYPGDTNDVSAALKINFNTGAVDIYGQNEMFSIWNYYTIVDPDTDILYAVSNDLEDGERAGLFYLPYTGGEWILLDTLPYGYAGTEREFIYNGYLYFDRYKHQLLTLQNIE